MIEFFPMGDDGLRARIFLPYSTTRVFRAWSSPEEFAAWFRGFEDGHLVVHKFDFTESGGFDVTMVSGEGFEANLVGTYLEIVADQKLSFTWTWRSAEGLSPSMRVDIEFLDVESGTLLVVTHQPFISTEDRDNHQSGWRPCLSNLARFLEQTSVPDAK